MGDLLWMVLGLMDTFGGGLTETLDYRFTIVLLCMCPLFLFYHLFLFSANCYVLV
jgi:hypothetical protein